MVLCVKVGLRDAQKIKNYLATRHLFANGYRYAKDADSIFFPVVRRFRMSDVPLVFEERELDQDARRVSWREAARSILTQEEAGLGRFSYDLVGTIAIVEIARGLEKKEHALAELLLAQNKAVKTVLKKTGGHEGEYRTQRLSFLAGVNTREAEVAENGCRFVVDVEKVYFSVRLAKERNRIAQLVKPGERILCMFSGAAPYPVVLAKRTDAAEIVGVEINPEGHRYGLLNVRKNKVDVPEGRVTLYCGDVNEVLPWLVEKRKKAGLPPFDRITMPLPHTGEEFLPVALAVAATGATIHYYTFIPQSAIEKEVARVVELVAQHGRKVVAATPVMAGQHAPRIYRVCIDITIV